MTPHATLGIHFNATREEVTDAYRKLAKRYHPDTNPGGDTSEKFQEVTEAYRKIIKDLDASRDKKKTAWVHTSEPTRTTLRRNVFLSVKEAMTGTRKELEGISGPCSCCSGSGKIPARAIVECTACFGTGVVMQKSRGFINMRLECSSCSGTGKVTWFVCHECAGFGNVHMDKCFVDIPPGSRHGTILTVQNGANDPKSNIVGDLEITVVIKDNLYRIVDNDIETFVDVDLWDAVLGGDVTVFTPLGQTVRMTIPAETHTGTKFRIRGQGLNYSEVKGDLIVIIKTKQLRLADPGVKEAMMLLKDNSKNR